MSEFSSQFATDPAKMSIVNLVTSEQMDAQFNPTEFEETVGAQFARLNVQGLSHQVTQFSYTENVKITFTLFFISVDGGPFTQKAIERSRRFLMSLCYPRKTAGTVRSGGAPRALFVWPNLVSLTCFVTNVKFSYRRFNFRGKLVDYSAQIALEEVRDALITSEEVFQVGTERPTGRNV